MKLNITVMEKDDKCVFYGDKYPGLKFAETANPLTFRRRALFTAEIGASMFDLPLEDAKAMAHEILKLGE